MCDTVVVVRPQGVLFAKNSDRDANEAQLLEWRPRERHPPGSRVHCTWIGVPQVEETRAVLLSRPFWMWGAEMGSNEHGVTIGNEAVFTRRPVERDGLTGMDLVRLALERAETAEAAVEVVRTMIARHGQGGGCGLEDRSFRYHNSFLIADPESAFVLETVGNLSAIERVEGVRAISNGLTIDGFQALHTDRLPTWVSECVPRRRRSEELAGSARGPLELMRSLRDHGSGLRVPSYGLLNGAMRCICMHGGGLVASSQTTASWVADIAPGRVQHWVTGTSAPCVSLFKPVRVDQPLQLSPTPTDRSDGTSLWWRHERLHRRALQDPATLIPLIAPERDELEAQWVKEVPDSGEAFAVGDEALARWLRRVDSEPIRDVRPAWVRRYWKLRNEWAELTLPR